MISQKLRLRFLVVFLLLIFSCLSYSQTTDPNTNPNWDWKNGDYPAENLFPASMYKMYIQDGLSIIEVKRSAPWSQGNAWIGLLDMEKADGWVLLARDFGSPTRAIWAPDKKNAPYFILYNKYKALLRFFALVRADQAFTSGAIELKMGDGDFKTATLNYLKPIAYAMDKENELINNNNIGSALAFVASDNWAWADFPMAYDPSIVPTNNGAWLDFNIYGTEESSIVIKGHGTGTLGAGQQVRDFMTKSSTGAVTMTESMPQQSSGKDLAQLGAKVLGTASTWNGWKKGISDFEKSMDIKDEGGIIEQAHNNLKLLLVQLQATWIDDAFPFVGAVVGLFDFITSGGRKSQVSQGPTYFGLNIELSGTITTKFQMPNPVKIQVPGSKLNPEIPVLGSATPLVYNGKVGVLALMNTPILKSKYYKVYESPPDYNGHTDKVYYLDFQSQSNLTLQINPDAGLVLDSAIAWVSFEPFFYSSGNVSYTADYENYVLSECGCMGGANPTIELESAVDGRYILRTVPVPLDNFNLQTFQFSDEDPSQNIKVKIQATLHRIDDPTATPVTVLTSYSPILQTSGLQGRWPRSFYVNIKRQFEFDAVENLAPIHNAGQTSVSVSTPQTYTHPTSGKQYVFAGWSDGVKTNSRSITTNLTITALYKVLNKSNNSAAFANNGQRKISKPSYSSPWVHFTYESMGKIWYKYSSNNGSTWSNEQLVSEGSSSYINTSASIHSYTEAATLVQKAVIVYQRQNAMTTEIIMKEYNNGVLQTSELVSTPASYPSGNNPKFNCTPLISAGNNQRMVIWKQSASAGLYVRLKWKNANNIWAWNIAQLITGTTSASVNPSVATKETTGDYAFLAYQQNEANNSASIISKELATSNGTITYPNTFTVVAAYNSELGYRFNNHHPSVTDVAGFPYVNWIQYHPYTYLNSSMLRYKVNSSAWSSEYGFSGGECDVLSTHITSVGAGSASTFMLAFSDEYSNYNNMYVKGNDINSVYEANTNGKYLQVMGGASASAAKIVSFYNTAQPYYFQFSNGLSGLAKKGETAETINDRVLQAVSGNAVVHFGIGDISLNGSQVKFKEVNDSLEALSLDKLENFIVSEEFDLSNSSALTYKIISGISCNSVLAAKMADTENLKLTLELIDSKTGKVLKVLNELNYNKNIREQYYGGDYYDVENIGFDGLAKLRIAVINNLNYKDIEFSIKKYAYLNKSNASKNAKKIDGDGTEKVESYALSQNFPNPFNPSTVINYDIPEAGQVSLKVYDILGREVVTLVDEFKEAGRYNVTFNASKLSTGVYIYQIRANDYVSVKKMSFIK